MIRKRLADAPGSQSEVRGTGDIDAAVRQVIGSVVDAGEVIDLFAAAGLDAARLDILSDEFLERVSALEQKNLALETLRKLLNDQIKISERTNLVQAQKFREALEKAMLGYTNKQISTAQMIAQLLELAKWVRDAKRHGYRNIRRSSPATRCANARHKFAIDGRKNPPGSTWGEDHERAPSMLDEKRKAGDGGCEE